MLGSRTFGGTIVTQISLGTVNFVGIGLVLIWVLSPLGTQAILRVLETRPEPITSSADVVFMETALNTGLTGMTAESQHDQARTTTFFAQLGNSLSSLLNVPQYIQADTMDLWGNVKIPFLGTGYDNTTVRTPATDWQDVVWGPKQERFSALAGIPLGSIPQGNTTLYLETGYIELNCYDFVLPEDPSSPLETVQWDWEEFWEELALEETTRPPRNGSWQGQRISPWSIAVDRFVDPLWMDTAFHEARRGLGAHEWQEDEILTNAWESPGLLANETGIDAGPTRLVFYASNDDSGIIVQGNVIWGYCDVRQRYVESRIHCERQTQISRQNCTAVSQRPSRKKHAPETISHLNFPEIFGNIMTNLPKATGVGGVASTDLGLRYLKNPRDMSRTEGSTDMFSGISADRADFSRRLSQLLNTYILLSSFDFGSVTEDGTSLDISPNAIARAEVSNLVVVYVVPRAWIAVGLLACLVLLLAGIASVVVTHVAASPEILGYASTLVRDSKFMDLPPDAGSMSASEITAMLKDRRVRYGYSELTQQGRPLMGVGPVNDIEKLGRRPTQATQG